MMSIVAIAVLSVTTLLVLGNLRAVSHDTVEAVTLASQRLRQSGSVWPRVAFGLLWLLIFALSFA